MNLSRVVALLFISLLFSSPVLAQEVKDKASSNAQKEEKGAFEFEEINWLSIEEAYEKQKNNPKKMLIDVYTDWCGPCKMMDKKTFRNSVIVDIINEHFYAVKLNAEGKETITLNGQDFEYHPEVGRNGINELAFHLGKNAQGGMSYPTIVYIDENFKVLQAMPGYKTPRSIEPILRFFGEGFYEKKIGWKAFEEGFESRL